MSQPTRNHSPDKQRPPPTLGARVATATTRLILIAIVAGALLTVALNLRTPSFSDPHDTLTQTGQVAPFDDSPAGRLPVSQEVVTGDEAAARQAVIRIGQEIMRAAAGQSLQPKSRTQPLSDTREPPGDAIDLLRDPRGNWSIRHSPDLPRRIFGVATTGVEPTIRFWGGYDETGPGEWMVWTMRLPAPMK